MPINIMLRCAAGVPGPPGLSFGYTGLYYCARFQVIAIRVFCFIVLTYQHTHIHRWQGHRN